MVALHTVVGLLGASSAMLADEAEAAENAYAELCALEPRIREMVDDDDRIMVALAELVSILGNRA